MDVIEALLDRALADPDFRQELARDPAATVKAAGLTLSDAEFQALRGMLGGNEAPVIEQLRPRVSHGYGEVM
jgi:hypothetical protein